MPRFYDKKNHRLIYIEQPANTNFWDGHWQKQKSSLEKIRQKKATFVSRITKRYIKPSDGVILEGGCGRGIHVAALVNNGYQCIGVDAAKKTVQLINANMPDLDIRLGDVRSLDFDDNTFSGYWSLGVIEHFWDGYAPIVREMARVLKTGGYLFLTCPYMSPLRSYKARANYYPSCSDSVGPADFYQFALDSNTVIDAITSQEFKLCQMMPNSGLKGFKDEMPSSIKRFLQTIYDYSGKAVSVKALRLVLDKIFTPFAGHTILFVFQKL